MILRRQFGNVVAGTARQATSARIVFLGTAGRQK
jgi:hypothetical protein